MDTVTKDDLKALSQVSEGPAVSLYLPTHRAGADVRENHIRFKNRVQEAARLLEAQELDPKAVDALLEPAQALVEDSEFWQQQADGLAMFLRSGESRHYRVPIELGELTVVAERYHLKPLMPLLSGDGRFYVLAASINRARLFGATRSGVSEVELPEGTPLSMDYATRFDDPEKSPQQHSTGGGGQGGGRQGADASGTTYHGTGAGDDDKSERILRYLKMLENGVTDVLDEGSAPLLYFLDGGQERRQRLATADRV